MRSSTPGSRCRHRRERGRRRKRLARIWRKTSPPRQTKSILLARTAGAGGMQFFLESMDARSPQFERGKREGVLRIPDRSGLIFIPILMSSGPLPSCRENGRKGDLGAIRHAAALRLELGCGEDGTGAGESAQEAASKFFKCLSPSSILKNDQTLHPTNQRRRRPTTQV